MTSGVGRALAAVVVATVAPGCSFEPGRLGAWVDPGDGGGAGGDSDGSAAPGDNPAGNGDGDGPGLFPSDGFSAGDGSGGDGAGGDGVNGGDAAGGDGEGGDPPPVNLDVGPWYPIGGSELGPGTTTLRGSASLGGISETAEPSTDPAVSAADGILYVAFVEGTVGQTRIRVFSYVPGAPPDAGWKEIGEFPIATGQNQPAVVALPSTLLVAFNRFGEVFVTEHDGNSWSTPLSIVVSDATGGSDPFLATDGTDVALVYVGTTGLEVRERDGNGTWSVLGLARGTGSGHGQPVALYDGSGRLWVAYRDAAQVTVERWTGTSWINPDSTVVASIDPQRSPFLALGALGQPFLAYIEGPTVGCAQVYGLQWNETASDWEDFDGSAGGLAPACPASGGLVRRVAATSRGGAPVVIIEQDANLVGETLLSVVESSDGDWANIGSAPGAMSRGVAKTPVIVASDDDLLAVWSSELAGGVEHSEIYARYAAVDAPFIETSTNITGFGATNQAGVAGTPVMVATSGQGLALAWSGVSAAGRDVYLAESDGTTWAERGGSLGEGGLSDHGNVGRLALAVRDDTRLLAWERMGASTSTEIWAAHASGSVWNGLNGTAGSALVVSNSSGANFPSVAFVSESAAARPWIAWAHTVTLPAIYVKSWNGTSWVEVAGSATNRGVGDSTTSGMPIIAATRSTGSQPTIVWRKGTDSSARLSVKGYGNDAWSLLGASDPLAGAVDIADEADLLVDSRGFPVVAWRQDVGATTQVWLRRWRGGVWEELGGSATGGGVSASSGAARAPSLAESNDGELLVAWSDSSSGNFEVYVRRWAAEAVWQELSGSATGGGISNSAGPSLEPDIVATQSRVCVSFTEADVRGRQVVVRCANAE